MYIEIYNQKDQFAVMGKKLTQSLNYKKGTPAFLQIVELRGEGTFAIVRREPRDTFTTQCCMVHRDNRRGKFSLTIPSIQYMCAVMGIPEFTRKVFKVKPFTTSNNLIYYKILCK